MVLAIHDPAAPFDTITDSCGYGTGAVLMQQFYSGKMTNREGNYVNHEQALLAATSALEVYW